MTLVTVYDEGRYGPAYDDGDGYGYGYGYRSGCGYGNGDDNSSGNGNGRLTVFAFERCYTPPSDMVICHDTKELLSVLINQQTEFTTHRG